MQLDKAVTDERLGSLKNYPGYRPGLFARDPNDPAYSETGLFGDPTKATAEKGKRAVDIMTRRFFEALDGFGQEPLRAKR